MVCKQIKTVLFFFLIALSLSGCNMNQVKRNAKKQVEQSVKKHSSKQKKQKGNQPLASIKDFEKALDTHNSDYNKKNLSKNLLSLYDIDQQLESLVNYTQSDILEWDNDSSMSSDYSRNQGKLEMERYPVRLVATDKNGSRYQIYFMYYTCNEDDEKTLGINFISVYKLQSDSYYKEDASYPKIRIENKKE